MIKRISMWRLKDRSDAPRMKKLLLSMEGKVASLQAIEVGVNTSPHESALDIVFIGSFSNKEALKEFEDDCFHRSIGEAVGKLKLKRVVVEYEV